MLRVEHLALAQLDDLILLQDALQHYRYERPSDAKQVDRLEATIGEAISKRREPDGTLARLFF
jgi:hypothetical protein